MVIDRRMKTNIREAIRRTRKANLNTTVVLEVCCYISGLAYMLKLGQNEAGFKKYVKLYMPKTFALLEQRSRLLGKRRDYCLHALWRDIRNGLVHEIDCKCPSAIAPTGRMAVHLTVEDPRWPNKELVLCSPRFVDEFLKSLKSI